MTVAMATREQKRCYKLKVEVARQNGEVGLVMPDIPLISTVKYGDFTGDDLLENGQPNYDKPGVGGSVLLGAIHGTQEFMAHHAGRMANRLMKQDARLSQYPRLQGQNFLRRVCAAGGDGKSSPWRIFWGKKVLPHYSNGCPIFQFGKGEAAITTQPPVPERPGWPHI